jgi:hypothetical protein
MQKGVGSMAQVIEHLPSKHKALVHRVQTYVLKKRKKDKKKVECEQACCK